jgi:hypothetical protein
LVQPDKLKILSKPPIFGRFFIFIEKSLKKIWIVKKLNNKFATEIIIPNYALDFVVREKRAKNLKMHGNFLPQVHFLCIEDKKLSTFSNLKSFFFRNKFLMRILGLHNLFKRIDMFKLNLTPSLPSAPAGEKHRLRCIFS